MSPLCGEVPGHQPDLDGVAQQARSRSLDHSLNGHSCQEKQLQLASQSLTAPIGGQPDHSPTKRSRQQQPLDTKTHKLYRTLVPELPIEGRPEEDRGHETALWYGFQYACTARDCLAMLINNVPWILCEWHTDFISAGANGIEPYCLVSVKHREADQGPWLTSELAKRGGLAVLYERWNQSGRKHTCRWITNAGLKPGESETRNLAELLSNHGDHFKAEVAHYTAKLGASLPTSSTDDIEEFLSSLTIFSTGGDARSFRSHVIEEVARPILAQLGVRPGLARRAYEAVHGLVLEAVKGFDPRTCNVTWYSGAEAIDADLEKRKITRERVLQCLVENGIAVSPDSIVGLRGAETAMIRKLRAGGLGPTVLAGAPRIRQSWYELEVYMRPTIPSPYGDDVTRIRAEVILLAGRAESKHRVAGNSYGTQMHRELGDCLNGMLHESRIRVTQSELLGCAYQLTDECEIWWSDSFDASKDAPWVSGEASPASAIQEELPFA